MTFTQNKIRELGKPVRLTRGFCSEFIDDCSLSIPKENYCSFGQEAYSDEHLPEDLQRNLRHILPEAYRCVCSHSLRGFGRWYPDADYLGQAV